MEIVKKKPSVDPTSSIPTGLVVTPDTRMRQAQAEAVVRYQMAFMLKRDWLDVQSKLLEACSNPDFAKEAVWTRVIDGDTKRDLSVRFAERAQQLMRNIQVDTIPYLMDDTATHYRVAVTDTESNTTASETFMVRHTVERFTIRPGDTVVREFTNNEGQKVFVVPATDEQIDAKKRAMGARVKRALLLSMMPAEVRATCLLKCVEIMEQADAVDPTATLKQILQSFVASGVDASDLKEYLGKPLQSATLQELQELRTLLTALRDGDTTWNAALEARRPKTPTKEAFVQQKQQERATKKASKPANPPAAGTADPPRRGRKPRAASAGAAATSSEATTQAAAAAAASPATQESTATTTEERPARRNLLSDDDDETS